MKKLFCGIIILMLILCLVACGNQQSVYTENKANDESEKIDNVNIKNEYEDFMGKWYAYSGSSSNNDNSGEINISKINENEYLVSMNIDDISEHTKDITMEAINPFVFKSKTMINLFDSQAYICMRMGIDYYGVNEVDWQFLNSDGTFANIQGIYFYRADSLGNEEDTYTDENVNLKGPLAQYVNKNIKDIQTAFGALYECNGYEGSSLVSYQGNKINFVLDKFYNVEQTFNPDIPGKAVVNSIISSNSTEIIDGLTGCMTYGEIQEKIGNKVPLETPEKWFNQMDNVEQYTLKIPYKDYMISYEWYNDPNTNKSIDANVCLK